MGDEKSFDIFAVPCIHCNLVYTLTCSYAQPVAIYKYSYVYIIKKLVHVATVKYMAIYPKMGSLTCDSDDPKCWL